MLAAEDDQHEQQDQRIDLFAQSAGVDSALQRGDVASHRESFFAEHLREIVLGHPPEIAFAGRSIHAEAAGEFRLRVGGRDIVMPQLIGLANGERRGSGRNRSGKLLTARLAQQILRQRWFAVGSQEDFLAGMKIKRRFAAAGEVLHQLVGHQKVRPILSGFGVINPTASIGGGRHQHHTSDSDAAFHDGRMCFWIRVFHQDVRVVVGRHAPMFEDVGLGQDTQPAGFVELLKDRMIRVIHIEKRRRRKVQSSNQLRRQHCARRRRVV